MIMTRLMPFFCYAIHFLFSSENCKMTVRDVFQAEQVIKEEGAKTTPQLGNKKTGKELNKFGASSGQNIPLGQQARPWEDG